MTRTMILLAFLCLVLTITLPTLAQQPDSTPPTDTLHPRILEERIKHLEDDLKYRDGERKRELDQRVEVLGEEIDRRSGELGTRMNLYLGIVFAFLAIFGYLGHKTVVRWIQQTIREKTDELFKDNEKDFKKRAEREADKLLGEVIVEGRQRFHTALAEEQMKFRTQTARVEKLIGKLPTKLTTSDKPLPQSTARNLTELAGELSTTKREDEYTAKEWFVRAYKADEGGDYELAVEYYGRAVDLDPDYYQAHLNRGAAFHQLKRYSEALSDYDVALRSNERDAAAHSNRGVTLTRLNRLDEALKSHNKAIEIDDQSPGLFVNRGGTLWLMKRFNESLKDIEAAVALDPAFGKAHENRAIVLFSLKRIDEAIDADDIAIKMSPDSVNARLNAAEHAIAVGKYDLAITRTESVFPLKTDSGERAVLLFLKSIAEKLLDRDTYPTDQEFENLLAAGLVVTWEFDEIENWLKTADIPEDARKFIEEKTELLKAKQKKKQ